MRLDRYLKVTRLVARRSVAGELCRGGQVIVNGVVAKSARPVRPGDRILLRFTNRELSIEVVDLPEKKSVSKTEARTLYTLLDEKRFDVWGNEMLPNKSSSGSEQ